MIHDFPGLEPHSESPKLLLHLSARRTNRGRPQRTETLLDEEPTFARSVSSPATPASVGMAYLGPDIRFEETTMFKNSKAFSSF